MPPKANPQAQPITMTDLYAYRFLRIKRTELEMMEDRGYNLTESQQYFLDNITTIEQFFNWFDDEKKKIGLRASLTDTYTHAEKNGKFFVFYAGSNQDPTKKIRSVQQVVIQSFIASLQVPGTSYHGALIIAETNLGPKAQSDLNGIKSVPVQVILEDNMTYNVTRHTWVPRHELLSKFEMEKVLSEAHVTTNQFPMITDKDPVIAYYGWTKGLVRIYRDDSNIPCLTPESVQYRVIVSKQK